MKEQYQCGSLSVWMTPQQAKAWNNGEITGNEDITVVIPTTGRYGLPDTEELTLDEAISRAKSDPQNWDGLECEAVKKEKW